MPERIGFVGLGIMGRPMAVHLSKRFEVVGFDVQQTRLDGLAGVTAARGVAEVGKACRVVFMSLPSAPIVEEVVLGRGGLLSVLAQGSLVIDLSTNMPSVSRRIAARLSEDGIEFADAPVSGGEEGARSASLAIMVGALPATFERCRPYLSVVGKSVVRVGDVGAGGIAKLVNNMIVGSTFAVIAEGFALAKRNGVDSRLLYDALRGGWAGSKVLDVSAEAIPARRYTPGGTIDMLEKDLSYARTVAAESRVPIPMTAAAHEIFVAGQAAGHGKKSQPAVFELWQQQGGA